QIQRVGNQTTPLSAAVDPESVAVALSKTSQLVVRNPEDFAKHTGNFVTRVRIDHDREERGQPGIGRLFRLTIAFGLDFDWNLLPQQCVSQCAQPRFSRTKNRNLAPRSRAQLVQTRFANPFGQSSRFDLRALGLGQPRIDVGAKLESNHLTPQNFRTRTELD